ncbi:hypothetical protein FAI41_04920 [Acetobacteraceae bacterium]|nr:hypothetical protein FAI41_04920 [Acetobacteraceae bacterium]
MYAFIVLGGYFLLAFVGGMGFVILLPWGRLDTVRHLPNHKIGSFRFYFERDIRQWQWPHAIPSFVAGSFLGGLLFYMFRHLTWSFLQPQWAVLVSLLLIIPIELIACKLADT